MAKVKTFGAPGCRVSFQLRDFLKRSSVDFDWVELKSDDEARQLPGITDLGDQRLPVCEFDDGVRLYRPSVRDVAERLGFLAKPALQEYDLSIYGAGPAGLSAAVYAASEGLKTILIERCAVGGQAGSSSRIENFLGFPGGISGAELAERTRRQALKLAVKSFSSRRAFTPNLSTENQAEIESSERWERGNPGDSGSSDFGKLQTLVQGLGQVESLLDVTKKGG